MRIAALGAYTVNDQFGYNPSIQVMIDCPNRNAGIKALLTDDLSWSVKSNWSTAVFGKNAVMNVLDTADTILQDFTGISIMQPIWNRKIWKGTSSPAFRLKLRFLALEDAKWDVMDQVSLLASFLLPAKRDENAIAAAANLVGVNLNLSETTNDVLNAVAGTFTVPGPSPFYPAVKEGNYLNIYIGEFISYEACYITSMSGTFSSTLSAEGYPMSADVELEVETMDAAYVGDSGQSLFHKEYKSVINLNGLKKIFK